MNAEKATIERKEYTVKTRLIQGKDTLTSGSKVKLTATQATALQKKGVI